MPSLRTSDGFFSVVALKSGEVEQQAWYDGPVAHTTTLALARLLPAPPLYRVKHLSYQALPDGSTQAIGESDELFDDIRKARNSFRKLRGTPPTTLNPHLPHGSDTEQNGTP